MCNMDVFLLHCNCIARGEGNWFNILIFAVVIGVGVIKSIYRAQSEKKAKEVSGEELRNSESREDSDYHSAGGQKAEPRKPSGRGVERISRISSEKEGGFSLETGTRRPSVKPVSVRRPVSRPVQASKPVIKPSMKLSSGMLSGSSAAQKYVDSGRVIQKTLHEVIRQEKKVGENSFILDSRLSNRSSELMFGEKSSVKGGHANLPELSSRDSLRKAILYYEILGKPLSEREFGGHHIF